MRRESAYRRQTATLLSTALLCFLFWASTSDLPAQNHTYTQYTVNDGLPSDFVYGVIEDERGYIWAYTENGMSRFDGEEWMTLTTADGLPSNDVYYAFKDSAGLIWLSTMGREACYLKGDSVHTLDLGRRIGHHNRLIDGKAVVSWSNSDTIALVDESGIVEFRTASDGVKDEIGWGLNPAAHTNGWFLFTDDRTIGFSSIDGLSYFEEIDGQLMHYPVSERVKNQLSTLRKTYGGFQHIIGDEGHGILWNKYPDGILKIETGSGEMDFLSIDLGQYGRSFNWQMTLSEAGDLHLGTEKGYIFLDEQLQITERFFPENINDRFRLYRLYIDSQGNRWIGSKQGGLFFIPFAHLKTEIFTPAEWERTSFEQIVELGDELLAITDDLDVYEIEEDGIRLIATAADRSELYGVIDWGEDGLLMANVGPVAYFDELDAFSEADELLRVDSLTIVSGPLKDWSSIPSHFLKNMKSIAHSSDGEHFYFSNQHTSYEIDLEQSEVRTMNQARSRCLTYDPYTHDVFLDDGDQLLFWDGDTTVRVTTLPDVISCIQITDEGYLWVGTENEGMYQVQRDGRQMSKISDRGYVRSFQQEGLDYFLASTEGVVWLSRRPGEEEQKEPQFVERRCYDLRDGLPSLEVQDVHLMGDHIYAATKKGIAKIDRTFTATEVAPPRPPRVTGMSVSGGKVSHQVEHILPHDSNAVEIDFQFLDYASKGDITYSYRLLPIEEDWQSTSSTKAIYPDLAADSYSFELIAHGISGERFRADSPTYFTIEEAWWRTGIIRTIAALILLALLLYFVHRREEAHQKKLAHERHLHDRITELRLESLRSQMNPHFIFNALGSIQYYIQTNKVEEADGYLTMFAQLMRRYLDSAVENLISLDEEVKLLAQYTELEMMRFDFKFSTHIGVGDGIDASAEKIPSMLVQPFVENAINHGLRVREDNKGRLEIRFDKTGHSLVCRVIDNGVGLSVGTENRESQHKSRGMANVRKRIETLASSDVADVSLDIRPTDPTAHYPGTTITLTFTNTTEHEL